LAPRNVAQTWIQRENWQFETHKFLDITRFWIFA